MKSLSGDSLVRLGKLLSAIGAKYSFGESRRVILVYAPKEVLAQIRLAVEELDWPGSEAALGRNIEMTFSFLLCPAQTLPGTSPLPADSEPVARQLRAAGLCKDVQLGDIVPVHLQEGKRMSPDRRLASLTPHLLRSEARAPLIVHPESVNQRDSGRYVRFKTLEITLNLWSPASKTLEGVEKASEFDHFNANLTTLGGLQGGPESGSRKGVTSSRQ